MARLKARILIEWEYDADPAHYKTSDPVEMSEIDKENFREFRFTAIPDDVDWVIEVFPVADPERDVRT